jgi:hypothetical protein
VLPYFLTVSLIWVLLGTLLDRDTIELVTGRSLAQFRSHSTNVLWSGRIADPEVTDANTTALCAFNDLVASDDRVETVVLTAVDGLTIARRR